MSDRPTITARFIGQDGSLGYRHGHIHDLRVGSTIQYPLVIRRADGTGYCPYSSVEAYSRNWQTLQDDQT